MNEELAHLESLNLLAPIPMIWIFLFIAVAVGAFMIAWNVAGYERIAVRKRITLYRGAILLSAAAASLACNLAMPYAMRLVRVVPEQPYLVEVAINLGTTAHFYHAAIKSMTGYDNSQNAVFLCVHALSNAALVEVDKCQAQPRCANFISGQKLEKTELLQALTFVRDQLAPVQAKSLCAMVDFSKL